MPRQNPLSLGKNARIKLPRELEGEAKLAGALRNLDSALDAWATVARTTIAEMDKVRGVIGEVREAAARAERQLERGEQSTKGKACAEVFDACNRLLDSFTM